MRITVSAPCDVPTHHNARDERLVTFNIPPTEGLSKEMLLDRVVGSSLHLFNAHA
jgi:hypothetical protein